MAGEGFLLGALVGASGDTSVFISTGRRWFVFKSLYSCGFLVPGQAARPDVSCTL